MKKIILSISFALVLLLAPMVSGQAFAKDYSITSADITAQINTNGSVNITETRTYSFSGSYSWADENINLVPKCNSGETCQNYVITNVSIKDGTETYSKLNDSVPGTFQATNNGNTLYIKWFYSAVDSEKTFSLLPPSSGGHSRGNEKPPYCHPG